MLRCFLFFVLFWCLMFYVLLLSGYHCFLLLFIVVFLFFKQHIFVLRTCKAFRGVLADSGYQDNLDRLNPEVRPHAVSSEDNTYMCSRYIYIYIYIHTYMCIYIYIYTHIGGAGDALCLPGWTRSPHFGVECPPCGVEGAPLGECV